MSVLTTPAATVEPAIRERPIIQRRSRWMIGLTTAWLVFALAHVVLTGRFWLWTLPAVMPPITLLLVPVLLLLTLIAARGRRLVTTGIIVAALFVGMPYSGVNLSALDGADYAPAGASTVHIVSLNTDYWGQVRDGIWSSPRNKDALFAFLREQNADVYLLQEHMLRVDNRPVPIIDLSDLHAAFPGYQAVAAGTLVTLSRLPIVGTDTTVSPDVPKLEFPPPYGLRVDVQLGSRVLSTYNVHLPVQLRMEMSVFSKAFYGEIQQRFTRRSSELAALTAAVRANSNPLLVAGDFNTSPAMGDHRDLLDVTTDAASFGSDLYPASWRLGGEVPRAWRVDWALVAGEVGVNEYTFLDTRGNSDHAAQNLRLSL